ncbi:MAG TPA: condensation domain-containing protein, partial [Blastocatellia bacterium]|nr:condensation domain-containing protein [Blastocatellia bacterium]
RVREVCGVEIGVRSVFEEPTAKGLASRIEEEMKSVEREAVKRIERVSREERLPLSFAQQRLWFIEQLEPGNFIYNCPGAVKLEGRLNVEVLESVINEIVRRHEVLRTRIEVEAGEPVQAIDEWEARSLEQIDLSGMEVAERAAEVERIAREEARTGFDLRRGPLMRVKVVRLGEDEHVVLFTTHHIVSDAWSTRVLTREIGVLYQALCEGKRSPLPDLKLQYADYAKWQRQYLTGAVLERHLAYWKRQLGGQLPLLELPADHPRPSIPSYRGATISFPLPAELPPSLKTLSRREGVTLFMLLLAAFKTLLYRYTGQEDIIIGTSAENRNRAEIEPLIGFFVNTLPLRTDLSGNPRFTELVARVKEVALGGYTHQDLPFERLVEEIQPERSIGQMPLFKIAFGVQNAPGEDLKLEGLKITQLAAEHEGARFDLAIWVIEDSEGMQVSWIYSQDLFEEETVARMHRHFETLLFGIVDRPEARLTNLDLSSQTESELNYQDQDDWGGSDEEAAVSITRKGISLSRS